MDTEQDALPPEIDDSDLTLRQAAEETPCSVKTLRRAIHKGELPERYALGPRGAQLVIPRAAFDQWRRTRVDTDGQGVSMDTPIDKAVSTVQPPPSDAQVSMVSTLQAAIDQAVRSAVVPLVDELKTTRAELGDTREQLGTARERLAHLEAHLSAQRAATTGPLIVRLLRRLLNSSASSHSTRR